MNEIQKRFDGFYNRVYDSGSPGDRIQLDNVREALVGLETKVITNCPCCTQRVKLYKRNLTVQLVRSLVSLVKITRHIWNGGRVNTEIRRSANKGVYIHWRDFVSDAGRGGAACSLLQHFGLISPLDTKTLRKGSKGFWAATDAGLQFVDRKICVPRSAYIYDNHCFAFSEEVVFINDVEGFKYAEEVSGLEGP